MLKNHQNEPVLSGVKNALAEYQAYEKGFSDGKKEHDAALIAQEREKWERERLSCVEDITPEGAAIVQAVKKQAREDVLAIAQHIADTIPDFNRMDFMMQMRSEVRK